MQLRAGVNRVLLKVCHEDSGAARGLPPRRVGARAPGDARPGSPLCPRVRHRRPGACRRWPPRSRPRWPGARTTRSSAADLRPGARGDPGLRRARAHRRGERRARRRGRRGAREHPDARLELLAARLQQDENLRRRHLEAALASAPDLLEARVLLARAELAQGHPERVLTLLQPLVQRWKAFVPAQVLLARAEDDLGDVGVRDPAHRGPAAVQLAHSRGRPRASPQRPPPGPDGRGARAAARRARGPPR